MVDENYFYVMSSAHTTSATKHKEQVMRQVFVKPLSINYAEMLLQRH
jgi:hypothetical protein